MGGWGRKRRNFTHERSTISFMVLKTDPWPQFYLWTIFVFCVYCALMVVLFCLSLILRSYLQSGDIHLPAAAPHPSSPRNHLLAKDPNQHTGIPTCDQRGSQRGVLTDAEAPSQSERVQPCNVRDHRWRWTLEDILNFLIFFFVLMNPVFKRDWGDRCTFVENLNN